MNTVGLIYFYHKDAMRHVWRMRHRLVTPAIDLLLYTTVRNMSHNGRLSFVAEISSVSVYIC